MLLKHKGEKMFLKIGNEVAPALTQKTARAAQNFVKSSTIFPNAEKAITKAQYTSPFAVIPDTTPVIVKVENPVNRTGLDFFA